MIKAEKNTLKLPAEKPKYITVNDITYAQVDSWFGHCRRDLKLDIIYPETKDGKNYHEILNYFFEGTSFGEVAEILVKPE